MKKDKWKRDEVIFALFFGAILGGQSDAGFDPTVAGQNPPGFVQDNQLDLPKGEPVILRAKESGLLNPYVKFIQQDWYN